MTIFEDAIVYQPRHLAARIREFRNPLREMNRTFLATRTEPMKLSGSVYRGTGRALSKLH